MPKETLAAPIIGHVSGSVVIVIMRKWEQHDTAVPAAVVKVPDGVHYEVWAAEQLIAYQKAFEDRFIEFRNRTQWHVELMHVLDTVI